MVRTQIYLARSQHSALRREAKREGLSMTELVRRIVGEHLEGRRGVAAFGKDAILSFVGLGDSGKADGSEHHDEVLDEAFRAERLP